MQCVGDGRERARNCKVCGLIERKRVTFMQFSSSFVFGSILWLPCLSKHTALDSCYWREVCDVPSPFLPGKMNSIFFFFKWNLIFACRSPRLRFNSGESVCQLVMWANHSFSSTNNPYHESPCRQLAFAAPCCCCCQVSRVFGGSDVQKAALLAGFCVFPSGTLPSGSQPGNPATADTLPAAPLLQETSLSPFML